VPTLTDLVTVDPAPGFGSLEGRSLLPLLRGEEWASERMLFAESEVPFFSYGWARLKTVRQGALKYIDAPLEELYDLEHDPGENHNLATERRREAGRLAAEIELWAAGDGDAGSTVPVDAEAVEMLRALGYLAGDPGPWDTSPAIPAAPRERVRGTRWS